MRRFAALLDRLPHKSRGVAFRLLAKDLAVEVFDDLSAGSQTYSEDCSVCCRLRP